VAGQKASQSARATSRRRGVVAFLKPGSPVRRRFGRAADPHIYPRRDDEFPAREMSHQFCRKRGGEVKPHRAASAGSGRDRHAAHAGPGRDRPGPAESRLATRLGTRPT
jgi:hypothetical protein